MDIQRSNPPVVVERDIAVHLSKEETLAILSAYVIKKLSTTRIKFSNIEALGSAEGKLETITLTGKESIPFVGLKETSTPAIPAVK